MRALVLAAAVASLLSATPALACVACACGDPIASRMGLPDTATGNAWMGGLTFEAARNGYASEEQDDVTIAATVGWTGTRSRLLVRVPYVRRELRFLGVERTREGAGDVEVNGMFELAHRGTVSRGQTAAVTVTAGLPTGEYERGSMEALQPGSGAPSAAIGFSWFAHRGADRVYVSASHRMAFDRPSGYRAGDVELLNAGWQRPVPYSHVFDFTLEANARRAAADRWIGWIPVADTGGDVLYLAPGLIALAGAENEWFLRLSAQIPVAQRTRGDQDPGPVVQAGIFRSF